MTDDGSSGDGTSDASPSPAAVVDDIDQPVLLFDGVCTLCNTSIRAIVRLDGDGRILFAPLQSEVGAELLDRVGMDEEYFESLVLVEPDEEGWEATTKSTAVLQVCRYLDGPLPLLWPLVYVPGSVRDSLYDVVAEYRYQVFGKKDECPIPPEHIRQRFLERSLA